MAVKFLKEGQDFEYPASFGFSGSNKGSVNPLPHPTRDDDAFGDGTYLAQQSANPPTLARGGRVPHHKPPHVAPKAAKAVVGALQLGEQIGEKKAAMAPAAAGAPPPGAGMAPPVIRQGPIPPQMMNCGGPVMRAQGGPADAKPKMNFDGGDHQYDSSAEGAKELAAPAFAGGGKVVGDGATAGMGDIERSNFKNLRNSPKKWSDSEARYLATNPVGRLAPDPETAKPTPRPLYGADDEEFSTRTNGPLQTGHMNTRTGETTMDDKVAPWRQAIENGGKHAKGGFIKGAIKHPGALHEDLGVPKGQKIPAGKLAAAAKQPGKVGQRARFAETLRGLNHKKD